jgi:hypothetical protein
MPTIIIESNTNSEQEPIVLLREDVQPEHLASEHHAAQLIERVGWAVTDARQVEVTRQAASS